MSSNTGFKLGAQKTDISGLYVDNEYLAARYPYLPNSLKSQRVYMYGALGNLNGVNYISDFQVTLSGDNWVKIARNDSASYIGLKGDGTLWSWGPNTKGILGLGDTTARTVPTQIGTATDWADFAFVGSGGSVAIGYRANGTLWSWGDNDVTSGRNVGGADGDTLYTASPAEIATDSTGTSISGNWAGFTAGYTRTGRVYALTKSGAMYAWGSAFQLDLGTGQSGSSYYQYSPKQIATGVKKMGINSNAFPTWIDTNGALWVKGFQPAQQLDDGSTRRWRSVTAMANPNGNLAISEYSVVAIDDQGFIWGSGPKVGTTIGTFVRLTQSGGWVEFMGGAVMSPMAVKKANGIIYKSQDYAYYNNLTTVTELEFSLALRYFPSSLGETLLSTNQVVYDSGATTIIVDGVI